MSNDSTLTLPGAMPLTMSSQEIAERTGKEHKNVLADIRKMLGDLGLGSAEFLAEVPDSYGRPQPCYRLPQRECLILVSGYSVELRARIIDRWQELEAEARNPLRALTDPISLRALLLENVEKRIELEAENANLRPAAAALERIAEADGSLCITDAAKTLQIRPKDLFTFLRSNGWIYRRAGTDTDIGYQSKLITGLLEHKTETVQRHDGTEKVRTQVRVTPKGLTVLGKLLPPAVAAA